MQISIRSVAGLAVGVAVDAMSERVKGQRVADLRLAWKAALLRLLSFLLPLVLLGSVRSHGLRHEREERVSQSALAGAIGGHGGVHLRQKVVHLRAARHG